MYPLDYTSSAVYCYFFIPSLCVFLSGFLSFLLSMNDLIKASFSFNHLPATGILIPNEHLWLLLALTYVPFGLYLLDLFYLETFSSSLGKCCSVFVVLNITYKFYCVNMFFEFLSKTFYISFYCANIIYFSEYSNISTVFLRLLFHFRPSFDFVPLSMYCVNIWWSPVLASPLNIPLKITAGVTLQPFSQTARTIPIIAQIVGMYLLSTSLIHFFTTYPTQRQIPTITSTKYSDKKPKSICHPLLVYSMLNGMMMFPLFWITHTQERKIHALYIYALLHI